MPVLKKSKKDNSTLFIDASKEFVKITNSNKLSEENVASIIDTFTKRENKDYVSAVKNLILYPNNPESYKRNCYRILIALEDFSNKDKKNILNSPEIKSYFDKVKEHLKNKNLPKEIELLDMPGVLWPKFEDPEVGMMLAYTGAVKEGVIDVEELACRLMELLHKYYPQTLLDRYKVEAPEGTPGWELVEMAGRKRGYLVSGGEVNTERMSKVLLDEFRGGKLGKFTLEMPEETV